MILALVATMKDFLNFVGSIILLKCPFSNSITLLWSDDLNFLNILSLKFLNSKNTRVFSFFDFLINLINLFSKN